MTITKQNCPWEFRLEIFITLLIFNTQHVTTNLGFIAWRLNMKLGKFCIFSEFWPFWAPNMVDFGPYMANLATLRPLLVTKRAKTGGFDYYFQHLHNLDDISSLVNYFSLLFPVWVFSNFVKTILKNKKIVDFIHKNCCHQAISELWA